MGRAEAFYPSEQIPMSSLRRNISTALLSNQRLRYLVVLRRATREKLLREAIAGPQRQQGYALHKLDRKVREMSNANRNLSKSHHKGLNCRCQRVGRGKGGFQPGLDLRPGVYQAFYRSGKLVISSLGQFGFVA